MLLAISGHLIKTQGIATGFPSKLYEKGEGYTSGSQPSVVKVCWDELLYGRIWQHTQLSSVKFSRGLRGWSDCFAAGILIAHANINSHTTRELCLLGPMLLQWGVCGAGDQSQLRICTPPPMRCSRSKCFSRHVRCLLCVWSQSESKVGSRGQ